MPGLLLATPHPVSRNVLSQPPFFGTHNTCKNGGDCDGRAPLFSFFVPLLSGRITIFLRPSVNHCWPADPVYQRTRRRTGKNSLLLRKGNQHYFVVPFSLSKSIQGQSHKDSQLDCLWSEQTGIGFRRVLGPRSYCLSLSLSQVPT